MAERDPFGRAKGEDPLAAMGWSAGSATRPDAGPADVAAPETAERAVKRQETAERVAMQAGGREQVPGVFGRSRRRGGLGCAFAVFVLLFIGSVAAVVIPAAMDAADEAEEAVPRIPSVPGPPTPSDSGGAPGRPGRPPSGLARASLLRRGNLAPALRRLRRLTDDSRLRLLRIDAGKVLAQTVGPGGRTRFAQATWRGGANVLSSSQGAAGTSYSWSQVDPSAPGRIVRAATSGRRASSFDYVVLIDAEGLRWHGFLKGGRGTFSASPDGRDVDRVG